MKNNRSMPNATVIPVLGYPDVAAAAQWLCSAFGFTERLRIGSHRVQLSFGGGSVVVCGLPASTAGGTFASGTHSIMIRVSSIDAHFEHVQRFGGKILSKPTTYPFGERQYTTEDLGGHTWTFSESVADVHPKEWGGELLADD